VASEPPCSQGPPGRTWRSSARSAGRPTRSWGCGPRSPRRDRSTPSSRCRSARRSERRRTPAACGRVPSLPTAATDPRARSRPESDSRPARHRTTRSCGRRPPARRRSPTASTTPARRPTAACDGRARRANAAWPQRPRVASCAPSPDSPSPPAARDRRRRGPCRASAPPTRRSSRRTRPPAGAAGPPPAARRRPRRGRGPSGRPSCDRTRRARARRAACPSDRTLPGSPSLPPHFSSRPPPTPWTRRTTGRSGQDRGESRWPPVGRTGDRRWGLSMAAYGEISMAAVSQQIVEPVFAHIKHLRAITRSSRRGEQAAQAEWQLIAATRNLLKLFRSPSPPPDRPAAPPADSSTPASAHAAPSSEDVESRPCPITEPARVTRQPLRRGLLLRARRRGERLAVDELRRSPPEEADGSTTRQCSLTT
jgi:hypothetical protein